jgi:hypothetical protein
LGKKYAHKSSTIMSTVITEPSICIPRTLHNITWREVKDVFEQVIGRGTVERVDIVASKNNESTPFCRIFVHFRYWPTTPNIAALRQRLLDGETIKVVYNNPWFWKCVTSRVPKPTRELPKTTPYIEYTSAVSTPTPTSETLDVNSTEPPPFVRQPNVDVRENDDVEVDDVASDS